LPNGIALLRRYLAQLLQGFGFPFDVVHRCDYKYLISIVNRGKF
jgi:hypothetical protein